ncbi:MAG TPA: hypothetical protein VGD81_08300 [Opitutaceae bacterium]
MNSPHSAWSRLAAAARRAPADTHDATAPYGFATRVAAMAFAQAAEHPLATLFDRVSFRALGYAGLLAVAAVAANLVPILNAFEEEAAAVGDPVVEMFDYS